MEIKKTRLAVFDFDGTLFMTPLPDTGKDIFKEKTGQDWPHKGWWGKGESMDSNIFNIPPVDSVLADFKIERANPETVVVLLTGRRENLGDLVKEITDKHELEFDEYHFNNGGATETFKMKTLDRLLIKYQDIKEVALWDDRLEHIPHFEQWGKTAVTDGRIKDFEITVVPADRH
jgi:hypothetical protein